MIGATATSSFDAFATRMMHGQVAGGVEMVNAASRSPSSMASPLLSAMLQSPAPRIARLPQTATVTLLDKKPLTRTVI